MKTFGDINNNNKIVLAVFGDIHGALDEMFETCKLYENIYQEEIDYILQTGDMGVFHSGSVLDKATKRFAKEDPTELGCIPYISGDKEAPIPVIFVAGNHEDFDFLKKCDNNYIDPYNKIFHISSGSVYQINKGDISITLAGIDGIKPTGKSEEVVRSKIGRSFYSQRAIDKLLCYSPGSVDILLCHEAPISDELLKLYPDGGSEDIRAVIERLKPKFCFYGHYKHPPDPFRILDTICIGTNNPRYYQLKTRESNMIRVEVIKHKNTLHWSYKLLNKNEL